MAEWPAEHRESGYQPQRRPSPVVLEFDLPDPRTSHLKLSPGPVIATSPENEIYEEHGRPREGVEKLRFGRDGDFDYMFGSMTSLNLESETILLPIFSSGSPYDSPDELHDHPSRPREGGSLVQHNLTESQPPMKVVSVEPPALSRRPSALEEIVMDNSSSSSESLPLPRPPSGPGPGPSPRPPSQALEDAASRARHPQSIPVQFRDPEQPSTSPKLFSMRNIQSLQLRSQSRQPQRRESEDDILEKIGVLRAEVWGLRSSLSEKRGVLREKELAKSVADDNFMKFIRTTGLGKLSRKDKMKDLELLRKLFEECEMLRNEYGPLEDDCNILENDLNNREYEMQKLEKVLDERWKGSPPSQPETASPQNSPPPSNYSGSEFSQDFHPLVAEYLSKIGDIEIFRERLDWHTEEKLTLEDEKERRERVDRKLVEADQKWLDNYSEAKAALFKELKEAEDDAEKLRMRCYSLGLVDEEGEPLDFERQERQTFTAEEIDAGTEKSDFVKFPLLLPIPGNKDFPLPAPNPQPDDKKEEDIHKKQNPSDRINDWLLTKLRSSPLDVNLLVRTSESIVGHIITGEKWQFDVLMFWYNDGSKVMATDFSRSLSEVATDSRLKTVEQPTSLSGRSGRLSMGFLIHSSRPPPPKTGEETMRVNEHGLLPPS
jgi:hypothetical protein